MNDALPDELFRNRIAQALRELELPETDAELEEALSAAPAEPLDPRAARRILASVREAIDADRSRPRPAPPPSDPRGAWIAGLTCAAVVVAVLVAAFGIDRFAPSPKSTDRVASGSSLEIALRQAARSAPSAALPLPAAQEGEELATGPREKRRVTLPDGSILSLNESTRVVVQAARRLRLEQGEVFVEVAPRIARGKEPGAEARERFVVETPRRSVTALGTKFVVQAQPSATNVIVTQGLVQVSGVKAALPAGKELTINADDQVEIRPAKRSSHVLDWLEELVAATGVFAPPSEHSGGTVTVVDPNGQELRLSLRKFHVDVHIEDGFARTTIDQTYFNHTWQQLEGTFRFPLPADASLSRLAMYVNGTLMEGGMVERDHGRNVFETIRHTRRDPALLEWVDGSTFQMRVFPLEPRQEKRIILSYSQRLPRNYGKSVYRFPAGHNLEGVKAWSAEVRVKQGAGTKWHSSSHLLESRVDQGDLVLSGREEHSLMDRDLIVELGDSAETAGDAPAPNARWSVFEQDGFRYVMLRYSPTLDGPKVRGQRHWIFLVENSGDRDALTAATQRQVLKTWLENVEHGDQLSLVRAATEAERFRAEPVACSVENIAAALAFLDERPPLGALDLSAALDAARACYQRDQETWIVHLGTGIPVLGERDASVLQRRLPPAARYVGVAVGKRWSKPFMEVAATRTGGAIEVINPDESATWKAFELLSQLDAPRLTQVALTAPNEAEARFLPLTKHAAHGQELAFVGRWALDRPLPKTVRLTGQRSGQPFVQELSMPVWLSTLTERRPETSPADAAARSMSGHLPRTWAREEIDRLVALGAAEHRADIIQLSKAMYVMSPFTSLLVLETEAMYAQFNVDRGRRDHWALYPAPATIPPAPTEQGPQPATPQAWVGERLAELQRRLNSAQSQRDRAAAEKRPATELARLDQLIRRGRAEEQRLAAERDRLEKARVAAEDPAYQAWESVVFRSPYPWGMRYLGRRGETVYWNRTYGLSGRGLSERLRSRELNESLWMESDESLLVREGFTLESNQRRWHFQDGESRLNLWDVNTNGIVAQNGIVDEDALVDLPNRGYLRYQWEGRSDASFENQSLNESVDEILVDGSRSMFLSGVAGHRMLAVPSSRPELIPVEYFDHKMPQLLVTPRIIIQEEEDVLLGLQRLDEFEVNAHALRVRLTQNMTRAKLLSFAYNDRRVALTGSFPRFHGLFRDLPSYAAGLQSWEADRWGLAEGALPADRRPRRGACDEEARRLVERCRALGWRQYRPLDAQGRPTGPAVQANGAGQFVYERTTADGLIEQAVCDGRELWHLYPELGLGAHRAITRFHQPLLRQLTPGYVPSIDDLLVEADVRMVGPRTVRIAPLAEREAAPGSPEKDRRSDAAKRQFDLELVFAESGQLAETRIIERGSQRIMARQTIDENGTVRQFDERGERVSEKRFQIAPCDAPRLEPDVKGLVVLPLPFRTLQRVPVKVPANLQTNAPDYSQLSESDALQLAAAYFAANQPNELTALVQGRFEARGDKRVGFVVLLSALQHNHPLVVNAAATFPDAPIAALLPQFDAWVMTGNPNGTLDGGPKATPFIRRLCGIYNHASRWLSDRGVNKERAQTDVERDLDSTLQFVRELESLPTARRLLEIVHAAFERHARLTPAIARRLNDETERLAAERDWPHLATDLRVRWLLLAGDETSRRAAETRLIEFWRATLAAGETPNLPLGLREAFVAASDRKAEQPCEAWGRIVRAVATDLDTGKAPDAAMASQRRLALLELARQLATVYERPLAAELVASGLAGADPAQDTRLNRALLHYAQLAEAWELAETCALRAIASAEPSERAGLWRDAANAALYRQRLAEWAERMDRALELEYEALPPTVDIAAFRANYAAVLGQLERSLELARDERRPGRDELLRLLARSAERWRALDPDDTECCQRVAEIYAKFELPRLAWDYATTPLAAAPDQSAPWQQFATFIQRQGRAIDADRAWRRAFECEPTNPELLLRHAEFLKAQGQTARARDLWKRIVDSTWQPRFDSVKQQATQLLQQTP